MYRNQNNEWKVDHWPVISILGEGSVAVNPDIATVILGVRSESLNLTDAQSTNTAQINNITNTLNKLGIPKEQIQTTDYRIETIYSYEDGKQQFQGYRVIHMLTIIIYGPEKVGVIVDAAVTSGANEISDITFSSSNSKALYLQALSLATANAWQKAETLARTIGVRLQPAPFSIIEETTPDAPRPFLMASYDKSSTPSTQVEPGRINIKASVRAQYSFV